MRRMVDIPGKRVKLCALEGKQCYTTQEYADEVVARIRYRNGWTHNEDLGSYKCDFCRQWHVGHGANHIKPIDPATLTLSPEMSALGIALELLDAYIG